MIERIRQIIAARQLSPTQFADTVGVARPIISHILSGRNKPSLEVVQKIISAFPDLALPWLLNGTGPMLAATPPVPPITSAESSQRLGANNLVEASSKALSGRSTRRVPAAPPQAAKELSAPLFAPFPQPDAIIPVTSPLEPAASTPLAPLHPPAASGPADPTAGASRQESAPPKAVVEGPAASLTAFAEPGKPIRRIVIFYQDGTFTDYRPEAN